MTAILDVLDEEKRKHKNTENAIKECRYLVTKKKVAL